MQLQVDDKMKLVSIWLTRTEAKDNDLRESLKPLYSEYKAKKYKVAVFESGDEEDLIGLTEALLKDNKYKLYKDSKDNKTVWWQESWLMLPDMMIKYNGTVSGGIVLYSNTTIIFCQINCKRTIFV